MWLYSNYHCNLACSYCLTESSPRSVRRELTPEIMIAVADQALALGFTALGVTGGEPFLNPEMLPILERTLALGPATVLTNATILPQRSVRELARIAAVDGRHSRGDRSVHERRVWRLCAPHGA